MMSHQSLTSTSGLEGRLLEPDPLVSCHQIGEGGVLFHAGQQRLFGLNATAALMWNDLCEGCDAQALVRNLAAHYSLNAGDVEPDVLATLRDWEASGLLAHKGVQDAPGEEPYQPPPAQDEVLDSGIELRRFRFLDSRFALHCAIPALHRPLNDLFRHLPDAGPGRAHNISIGQLDDSYCVVEARQLIGCSSEWAEMVPIVNAHVMVSAYHDLDCLSVFHAGAVSDGQRAVMLSAESGSGKSTLTAALAYAGFSLLSDEVVPLLPDGSVVPAPACIGLKTGAWSVLERRCAPLAELPSYRRQDDKYVRFLPPESQVSIPRGGGGMPVAALVFPHYQAGAETCLQSIGPIEALVRLTDAGYHTNAPLRASDVEQLLDWIAEVPAYTLALSDRGPAIDAIRQLLKRS